MTRATRLMGDRAGLVSVPGFPFPVQASRGLEERAKELAGRCARAYQFLGHTLGLEPEVTVLVLSENDWPGTSLPYGMPHYASGHLVLAGGSSHFWRSFVPLLERAPPEDYARAVEVYGPEVELEPFFNLLAVHELGHAFHGQSHSRFPRRWLEETFANLCLHAYVDEVEVELLPVLKTFPDVLTTIDPDIFDHRSLAAFEAVYSSMDPRNYGWYQCHFHVAAGRIHDAGGVPALQRFWRRFVLSDHELAQALDSDVHAELAATLTGWPRGAET